MAVSEYHLDTRIRRRHVPLITQQRRLRHLRSISARNITVDRDLSKELTLTFTLHKKLESPAFYTSEVIADNFNPSWKDFESSNFPDFIDTASSYVIIRIWNKNEVKLIEWAVFFSGLVYLGEQIPKEGKNFKPNTIIFGISEGYYGCNESYQHTPSNSSELTPKETIEAEVSGLRTSYTLSTLSRIKTIERAIKQTEANVQRRRNSISDKLQSSQEIRTIQAKQELLRIKISVLQTELRYQQKNLKSLEKEVDHYREELVKKKIQTNAKIIEDKRKVTERCYDLFKSHNEYREKVLKTEAQLYLRRKELITELSCIYPIVEFPDHNGYSILNVHLPNSESLIGPDEKMISVALGYVCHVVLMISQFLNVPLRYNINFFGSQSTIVDHIASGLPDKTREFQLYLKAKDKRTFEYGVFLLNKDIAQLRILNRLSTHDLSATLFNLSSLIESRLSLNSDSHSNLPKLSKAPLSSEIHNQNGLASFPSVEASQSSVIKTNSSEMETLKKEMEAMIPDGVENALRLPLKNQEALTVLSSSLDKGLNIIKLEMSLEMENKEAPPISSAQVNLLKQNHHHSSFPNLNSTLQVSGEFDADGIDPSLLSTPKVWTSENSRTNSEEEHAEDENLRSQKHSSVVLNDSIFYIPSLVSNESKPAAEENGQGEIDKVAVSAEFSADLSLRTEQLANRKSSFQMQKLRSSSEDEQLPHV